VGSAERHWPDPARVPGPRRCTAPRGATGGTDGYVAGVEAADAVETVIVVVLTDGKENASETPQETVRERVEEYRAEHEWEFLFIGANQDAALTAERMGMDRDKSLEMAHDGDGAAAAQESGSASVSRAREQGSTDGVDEADRQAQQRPEDRGRLRRPAGTTHGIEHSAPSRGGRRRFLTRRPATRPRRLVRSGGRRPTTSPVARGLPQAPAPARGGRRGVAGRAARRLRRWRPVGRP
jgi:hypothetical protein